MSRFLPKTPEVTRYRVGPPPVSADSIAVDSPLNTLKKDIWTVCQLEQSSAAQALFPPVGDPRGGASFYTARDFIREAVTFLSPNYSDRQKSFIIKSMCKHYGHLLVDLSASVPVQWTNAMTNGHVADAFTQFLKTFAKLAYAETLTTHRMSIRSIFEASKNLVHQHAANHRASPILTAPAPISPVQASPFSILSTPATTIFDPFDFSSPLQPQTPFTPFFTPLTTVMDPEFGFPTTPPHDAVQFFNRILDSRSQRTINLAFKLEYLNEKCARKDAQIAKLEGAASGDAPAQVLERDFFDGLRGDMVLDKLQHLGQRISELRHEIDCTVLLIELKDIRIAQLQAMADADAVFESRRGPDSTAKELRSAQMEELREEAEIDGSQSEAITSLPSSDDNRPSFVSATLNPPAISHQIDSTIDSAGFSLASRIDNEDQTLLINEEDCNSTLVDDPYQSEFLDSGKENRESVVDAHVDVKGCC
ncbi:uncharacterized protein N0V89_000644 [Didymosphaeria variabile]|uniref:Uncharacterized protein n=1 Tax=Didymosphaeria variabile TaxID=1932322 RepID=A0A9W8XWJ0_9PLEO|nr:uncharacterized protein N0V89_000644 [Didymosphaeria variabile]KAJ4360085.1 hypothetical protein N0V89_000644 [Didymosphaeria variabile]